MRSNFDDNEQILDVTMIQESYNSGGGGDGSNAIILPGKKINKSKDKGKGCKKNKDAPVLSKKKERKLKQLEEEKRKKLLLSESFKILKKHQISESAHSILQSSGTIGQAETFKGKRLRAVQLSKAGLEVPEDISPFKKRKHHNLSDEDEASLKVDSGQSLPRDINGGKMVLQAQKKERDNGDHKQSLGINLCEINKCQEVANVGTDMASPMEKVREKYLQACTIVNPNGPSSIVHGDDKGHSYKQYEGPGHSNEKDQHVIAVSDFTVQGIVNSAVVVHVSRPNEVEKKRKDLPIIMMEQEIMEAINEHSIVIICGETGCGKTTQVPQFLYEAGFGASDRIDRKGMIGVTQPRRVAVLATAKRVAYELGFQLGKEVGFQVRHDKLFGQNCSIKFMTDGILLREIQSDFLLRRYSVIILDEAHERSLNTDILIGMLSRIVKGRQEMYRKQQEEILSGVTISPEKRVTQLKLVLMSATLRVEDFISNRKLFEHSPPILDIPVRQFPVTIHFSKRTNEDYLGQAYKKVMAIHKRLPPGGILVFVTGQREVEFLCKRLRKASQELSRKESMNHTDDKLARSSELNMEEINEALNYSPDQQTDRFSSFEDDDNTPDVFSYSCESGTDSELDFESEDEDSVKPEALENTGFVSDILRDVESFSSLKASFDALVGKSSDGSMKPTHPLTCNLEKETKSDPSASPLYVLPLYAMLPASAQLQVFDEVPVGERLVVIATNVAETSITIPGIKYVVDTGKEKVKKYNHTNGMERYEVSWISKASAAQRAGRAGRTGPGHCYRLYSAAAFSKNDIFPEFSCPEILKVSVDGVVLNLKFMGIDKVANFPFPTSPNSEAFLEAENCLKALEALDGNGKLTPLGKAMAQFPMSPRHSRMLLTAIKTLSQMKVYSRANLVLGYAIAAAAALSFPNPFLMHIGENHGANNDVDLEESSAAENFTDEKEKQKRKKFKAMAREAHARFCNPSSDALTIAYALQLFELAENSFVFCSDNLLHMKTMEEMSKTRKQLLQLVFQQSKFCEEFLWNYGSIQDVELSWHVHSNKHPLQMNDEEIIGQCICAGWADRVAKRVRPIKHASENDKKVRAARYQSCALADAVCIHRGSSAFQSAPEFLVYTELLQAKRPYMHGVTSIKSEWLVKYASSLCTFSAPLTDPKPYYDSLNDQVLCWVSPTFGRHNWQLQLHSSPIKSDSNLRLAVFAIHLLEGHVLPCLQSVQKFLAAPPSIMLRPEAMGQKRVADLLDRLKISVREGNRSKVVKFIHSRAMLREIWTEDPHYLYSEIQQWFQQKFHSHFGEVWEQMHSEVCLEDYELFPKRAKKKKKKNL